MPEPRPAFSGRRPGDRLAVVGAVVFGVGLLATLSTVVPLLLGLTPLPTLFYLASMLAPVGLGLALVGMVRGNRARRQRPASRSPRG